MYGVFRRRPQYALRAQVMLIVLYPVAAAPAGGPVAGSLALMGVGI